MENLFLRFKSFLLIAAVLAGFIPGFHLPANVVYTKDEAASYTEAAKTACGKGMVVLIGGGFDTQRDFSPLIELCIKHANREKPRMLFIPTAHYDNLEERENIVEWFAEAGCETEILLVSKSTAEEAREKIGRADIIYETGGNLRFLAENWREKGVFEAVRSAFDRGAALIGVSSGAMCWARRGWDDFGEETVRVIGSFPFIGRAGSFQFQDCADLIPFCVCPHFDNTGWRMFSYEAIRLDIPSLAIENGAAVVFENGAYSVVSDRATPLRTAYLFCPERGIALRDLKTNADLAAAIDGEFRGR